MKIRISIVVLFILFLGASAGAQEKTISFAMTELPPYVASSLPGQGLVPSLVRRALEPQGWKVTITLVPFPRLATMLADGTVDAIAPLYKSVDRESWGSFSRSLGIASTGVFTLPGKGTAYNGLKSLEGKTVGVLHGGLLSPEFTADPAIKKDESNDYTTLVNKVFAGRTEFIAGNRLTITDTLATMGKTLDFLSPPLAQGDNVVIVGKKAVDGVAKLAALEAGFDKLVASGEWAQIYKSFGLKLVKGELVPLN